MSCGLKDRTYNISSSARKFFLFFGILSVCLAAALNVVYTNSLTVTIADGKNNPKEVTTFKRYVGEVLKSEGIALNEGDKMNVLSNDMIKDDMVIEIYRAFPISIIEKGEATQYKTTKNTVSEAFNELGVNVKETDIITPGFNEIISSDTQITIVRTSSEIIEVSEEIPYECTEEKNDSIDYGETKLVQNGKNGEKKISYKVEYEDGVEKRREKIDETVVSEPVKQIKHIGTKKKVVEPPKAVASTNSTKAASPKTASNTKTEKPTATGTITTSRSGNLSYSKVISLNATAYDASSCGKSPSHPGYGITATGRKATKGVVAVDPSVIPLGSKLYIEASDGSFIYGSAVAADTGGAIKGNRIDLCFNTRTEALNFGRRNVKVYVLN